LKNKASYLGEVKKIMMDKIKRLFNGLTVYGHFLVFLIILTVLKIINVKITEGLSEAQHFAMLGVGLVVISSILHFVFSRLFDK
jgi:hypothetical protein